jgi:16S rRNA processing protein RimM
MNETLNAIDMSDNSSHKTSLQESENTDQSNQGEIEYIAVGQLRRPHGVRGEILMSVWTEFPERLQPGVQVFLGEERQPVLIRSVRSHGDGLLLAFDEYHLREEVGLFRNELVMVRTDDRPSLEDGELYIHQLLGLAVVEDESGRPLGTLVEILETGANDVYIVKDQNGVDLLLPAIESVIVAIDLPNRQIRVHLLPGLLEA